MNKYIITILTIILFSQTALAEWKEIYSQEVHTNQNITINNITITDISFPSPVTGHINRNGILILDSLVIPMIFLETNIKNISYIIVLEEGETYTDNNTEIQITASKFTNPNSTLWEYSNYNPSAILSINTWQYQTIPTLEINLTPQYPSIEYGKYQTITISSNIKNLNNIPINIDITPNFGSLLPINNNAKQHFTINSNNIQTVNWSINIPPEYFNHTLNITVSIPETTINYPNGTHKNTTIFYTSNTTLQITPPTPSISIQKIIPQRLYTCINNSITLIISNNGIYDIKDITITDNIPNPFTSPTNTYTWNIPILKSGTQLTFYEKITPIQPGTTIISPATLTYSIYQQYTNISNTPNTTIISTGKTCTTLSIIPSNVTQHNNSTVLLSIPIPPKTPFPTPIQVITPIPILASEETIIKWTPGFEPIFVMLGIFISYKLKRKP